PPSAVSGLAAAPTHLPIVPFPVGGFAVRSTARAAAAAADLEAAARVSSRGDADGPPRVSGQAFYDDVDEVGDGNGRSSPPPADGILAESPYDAINGQVLAVPTGSPTAADHIARVTSSHDTK